MCNFVGSRIDGGIQPVGLPVEADHRLVDRELIRTDRREGLEIGFVNPPVNRHMTPADSQLIKNPTSISYLY